MKKEYFFRYTMSKYLPKELIEGIHVYKGKDYSPKLSLNNCCLILQA